MDHLGIVAMVCEEIGLADKKKFYGGCAKMNERVMIFEGIEKE
jgi:hypothetical protein